MNQEHLMMRVEKLFRELEILKQDHYALVKKVKELDPLSLTEKKRDKCYAHIMHSIDEMPERVLKDVRLGPGYELK